MTMTCVTGVRGDIRIIRQQFVRRKENEFDIRKTNLIISQSESKSGSPLLWKRCLLSFSRCVGFGPSKTLHITIHQQMLQDYSRNINLVLAPACSHWSPKNTKRINGRIGNLETNPDQPFHQKTVVYINKMTFLSNIPIHINHDTADTGERSWTNYSPHLPRFLPIHWHQSLPSVSVSISPSSNERLIVTLWHPGSSQLR